MDLRNRHRLVGNVGTTPQLRFNGQGSPVTDFRLAVDEATRPGDEQTSQWYTVELWGRNAERACELIKKGANVTVEGRLKHEEWVDGENKHRCKLLITNADFIIHKDGNGAGKEPPA